MWNNVHKIAMNMGAAPPLDLHSPDPATPLSAAQGR